MALVVRDPDEYAYCVGRRGAARRSVRTCSRGWSRSDELEPLQAVGVRPDQRNMRDAYERTLGQPGETTRALDSDARFLVAHAEKKASDGRGVDQNWHRRSPYCSSHAKMTNVVRSKKSLASDDAFAFVHVRFEVEADDAPVVYAIRGNKVVEVPKIGAVILGVRKPCA